MYNSPCNVTRLQSQFDRIGPLVHIIAEDSVPAYQGKIIESADRFLAVNLAISPQLFSHAPSTGHTLQCTITGDGCIFRFAAVFLSSSALPETIWYLEKPTIVHRIQQRRFVRVPMALPLTVRLPGEHGCLHNAAEATIVDISGGGLCFTCPSKIPLKVRIAIDIPNMPRLGRLRAFAQVERCTAIEIFNGQIYHIGASLDSSLGKREQEKLVKSIFEIQREYLQKGLRLSHLTHTKKP